MFNPTFSPTEILHLKQFWSVKYKTFSQPETVLSKKDCRRRVGKQCIFILLKDDQNSPPFESLFRELKLLSMRVMICGEITLLPLQFLFMKDITWKWSSEQCFLMWGNWCKYEGFYFFSTLNYSVLSSLLLFLWFNLTFQFIQWLCSLRSFPSWFFFLFLLLKNFFFL